MTPERFYRAKELIRNATAGPWSLKIQEDQSGAEIPEIFSWHAGCVDRTNIYYEGDARFIAESRTLLPAALDEIESLGKKLAQTKKQNRIMEDALWVISENDADYAPSFRVARKALTQVDELEKKHD